MSTNRYVIPVDGKVLGCLDVSAYTDSVVDHAAWAAMRLQASLCLLHAIDRRPQTAQFADYSGNIGIHAQSALLNELVELDERRSRLAAEHGRELLARARQRAATAGVADADSLQRHGPLVETLTDLEADVRLIVMGKRGASADFDKGHLGASLERAVRAVHRPLLVASRAFKPVQRFAIAFDGSPTTRKCVDMVAMSPLLKGLPCHLLSAGDDTSELRMAQDWARTTLETAGYAVDVSLHPGNAESVIIEQVAARSIDLLVMGAYGHSRIRQLIVGSTTTAVMRGCLVPLLLLR